MDKLHISVFIFLSIIVIFLISNLYGEKDEKEIKYEKQMQPQVQIQRQPQKQKTVEEKRKDIGKVCAQRTITDILSEKSKESLYYEGVRVLDIKEEGNRYKILGESVYFHEAFESVIDNPNANNSDNTTKVEFNCVVELNTDNTCVVDCTIDGNEEETQVQVF